MPWRGPQVPNEFPTLGYLVGEWIEENVVVPDGPLLGEPYKLTDEMWRHLLFAYRLDPKARQDDGADAFAYGGTQLVRPQKWGKDPFGAARCIAHALGPICFAGWDADGEPVGMPHPSPWIAVAAFSEDQTDNTYRPIVTMLSEGPLAGTPGLDIGDTRTKLPGVGWIDPVTSSAKGRLGGRFTFVSVTEPHLLIGTHPTGGVTFARVLKRNVAGMNGMWQELTNPWDPTEFSAAQLTYEAKDPAVWIDYRLPRVRVDIQDTEALRREVIYLYGDSARANGGWVSEQRIIREIQNPAAGEAEVRRFYLQEITGGTTAAVTKEGWDALARDDDPLRAGEDVALGFDGSRSRDATSLRLCRIRDGRLFRLRIWTPSNYDDNRVPRREVHQALVDTMAAYKVWFLLADPYKWQEYLDIWSGLWPDKVVEFPTNVETKMDAALQRFLSGYRLGELTHDGDPESTQHALDSVLVKGKKKPRREGEEDGVPEYYLALGKKNPKVLIDDMVAGVLAYHARGLAIEKGALNITPPNRPAAARVDQGPTDPREFWRPNGRLSDLI